MSKAVLLALTALAVIIFVCPQAMAATKLTEDFVAAAVSGNTFEIESSKVALERSQNPAVKEYAQQMITEHNRAGEEMSAALSTAGVDAPQGDALSEPHRKALEKLKGFGGPDFDKAYISSQIDAHNEAVALFKGYADDGDQSDLKEFAMHTLPVLLNHKDHVQGLQVSQ